MVVRERERGARRDFPGVIRPSLVIQSSANTGTIPHGLDDAHGCRISTDIYDNSEERWHQIKR